MVSNVFVTAATSQLGSLTVEDLLKGSESKDIQITVGVRDPAKVPKEWTSAGVKVVKADYTENSEQWAKTLQGQDKVLLISSNTGIGAERVQQHKNVIDGAKKAGVKILAYTSILNADRIKLILAQDHQATEAYLKTVGLQYVLLRNGWYTENVFQSAAGWPHTHTHFSAAGDAKFSYASRADYAAAAAAVLRPSFKPTKVAYELGGDKAYTLSEFTAIASKSLGYELKHQSLPKDDYVQVLTKNGIPEGFANIFADADYYAEKDQSLYTESKDLSILIGRPTEPIEEFIPKYLKK
ncbi:NmrA family protein [Meira miltonrushii]|uniref:NmrA family protein n=1 Tax=Meira miltonrushii TaxID=1280837 RepID=A0A316V968_9BASI|nr:NmrA family protein [Meira miltonrushii]PWN34149.1 NmrA family protein [Meira miltonrushii]